MRLQQGTGGKILSALAVQHRRNAGKPFQLRHKRSLRRQDGLFQPVCHRLRGFHQQHPRPVGQRVHGGSQIGKTRRLEALSLHGHEVGFQQYTVGSASIQQHESSFQQDD